VNKHVLLTYIRELLGRERSLKIENLVHGQGREKLVYKYEEEVQDWICIECGEYRINDPKVKIGHKCMICTYEYRGGE
jgi:hypothetical protein